VEKTIRITKIYVYGIIWKMNTRITRETDRITDQNFRDSRGALLTEMGLTTVRTANTPDQMRRGVKEIAKGLIFQNPPRRVGLEDQE